MPLSMLCSTWQGGDLNVNYPYSNTDPVIKSPQTRWEITGDLSEEVSNSSYRGTLLPIHRIAGKIDGSKFGGLPVGVETNKLKLILPATRNDIIHAV